MKLFIFLLKYSYLLIVFFVNISIKVFFKLKPFFLKIFESLQMSSINFTPLTNIAIYVIDIGLLIFVSIPWFIFGEVIKPLLFVLYNYTYTILSKSPILLMFLQGFFKNLLNLPSYTLSWLIKTFNFFWKKFIDFLFFDVYMQRENLKPKFFYVRNTLFKFYLIYLFFYKQYLSMIHTYIFFNRLESFQCWLFDSNEGLFNIFLSLLNPDNFYLLLWIVFVRVGIINIFNSLSDYNKLVVGYNWMDLYQKHKLDNPNFSFFAWTVDNFWNDLVNNGLEISGIPLCFFFGCLFFSTVILSWFFFSYLGLYGIFKLNLMTLFPFWVSLLFGAESIFVNQKIYVIKICNWVFVSSNVQIDYYFLIDSISFAFILLTTTIALFVFIYAFSYFRYEPLVDRFLLFLLSFVVSMLFLVASGNLLMLFLGWELIGFTSFCLINFWTTKTATLKSAFKAYSFNKVSDFYMFMFLVSSFSVYYTLDILSLNGQVYIYEPLVVYIFGTPVNHLEFLSLMIIGAAFIKSAQFGGHAWLPDSMEAPVPASSLIHSATLVSAGVYLILRFNFIFDCTEYSKFIIPVIGSLTAAYGGVCAVAQSDIKKTLAYSTISHCGFLMVLCATEMNEFTILYLYVHGFFKAGVFMCVGNVLRITRGYQDTRRMGGLLKYLPFEYFCAVVGVLNLAGLPFTFGFFIKHLLLVSIGTNMYVYYFVVFHSLVGAFAGLFYSYRLITYVFNDFKKGQKILYQNANRSSYNSYFYTNSSIAATLSVFGLFISAYVITYFMFKCFTSGNFLFSDYMNSSMLTTYYSVVSSYNGYLLNFSYINLTVVVIIIGLIFSKFRKVQRFHNLLRMFFSLLVFSLFIFLFYNFL